MLIINPGTGSIKDGKEELAINNIKQFIKDSNLKDISFKRMPEEDEDGYFTFLLQRTNNKKGRSHSIDMPGLPLEKVRYLDSEEQNIFNFQRLYVDGSSWVWMYALLSQKDFDLED
jgi:hypothetical protein